MKTIIAILLCLFALACVKGNDRAGGSNGGNSQVNKQEERAEGGKRQERRARRALEEHFASSDPQFKNLKVELFHTNPQFPNKAYIAVSGVRESSPGNSAPQPETKGFIMVKEGDEWRVGAGNQPVYTTSAEEADKILAAAN
jgi:hypothetical protein